MNHENLITDIQRIGTSKESFCFDLNVYYGFGWEMAAFRLVGLNRKEQQNVAWKKFTIFRIPIVHEDLAFPFFRVSAFCVFNRL